MILYQLPKYLCKHVLLGLLSFFFIPITPPFIPLMPIWSQTFSNPPASASPMMQRLHLFHVTHKSGLCPKPLLDRSPTSWRTMAGSQGQRARLLLYSSSGCEQPGFCRAHLLTSLGSPKPLLSSANVLGQLPDNEASSHLLEASEENRKLDKEKEWSCVPQSSWTLPSSAVLAPMKLRHRQPQA